VTAVTLDAAKANVTNSVNTSVTDVRKTKTSLAWVQLDHALPLPLPAAKVDPFLGMVEKISDLDQALDRETLQISGLAPGNYSLQVDDRKIVEFSAEQLAGGVDLARLDTPMLQQALLLAFDTERKDSIESMRFTMGQDARAPLDHDTVKELDAAWKAVVEQQRKDVQPVPHRYVLVPVAKPAGQ
jgi:hypothetical protein